MISLTPNVSALVWQLSRRGSGAWGPDRGGPSARPQRRGLCLGNGKSVFFYSNKQRRSDNDDSSPATAAQFWMNRPFLVLFLRPLWDWMHFRTEISLRYPPPHVLCLRRRPQSIPEERRRRRTFSTATRFVPSQTRPSSSTVRSGPPRRPESARASPWGRPLCDRAGGLGTAADGRNSERRFICASALRFLHELLRCLRLRPRPCKLSRLLSGEGIGLEGYDEGIGGDRREAQP